MSAFVLPPALAPWQPWLDLYPAELALSLGPMIQRLAAAIGPFALPARSGLGEPDGFGGLDRRGTYERLLASEWLLAELAPDEFIRRAAAGEHAFLRLERREPALARTCVVLFDAGPAQLGAPRLAHLAALIAFARRADAAGASLAWGLLQEPDVPLVHAVTRDTIRALLARRTAVPVAAAHVDAWRARLSGHVSQDTWLVGGPAVRAHAWPGAATIELRDLLADPAELAAVLRTAGGRTADVRLPLPDGPMCVRLIRDPFPAERRQTASQGRRTRRSPATNLVITSRGDRVFAGARDGGVIVYPVPHSASGGVGRPKLHFTALRQAPRAVGWHNRGAAALSVHADGAVTLFRKAHRSASGQDGVRYHDSQLPLTRADELRLLRFRGDRTIVHDGSGKLVALRQHHDKSTHIERITAETLAVADTWQWLAHVSLRDPVPGLPGGWSLVIERGPESTGIDLGPGRPRAAHFAQSTTGGCLCALAVQPGRWALYGDIEDSIDWATDDRVIGLLAARDAPNLSSLGDALVVLASERDFLARGLNSTVHLHTAHEPVAHAVVAPATGHLAYSTVSGAVVVVALPESVPLARFVVEES